LPKVMERFGKSMKMMMPVEQYDQWRKERETFFAFVEGIGKANKNIPAEKIEGDIIAAKRTVRKAR
jgi:hypothetical protein